MQPVVLAEVAQGRLRRVYNVHEHVLEAVASDALEGEGRVDIGHGARGSTDHVDTQLLAVTNLRGGGGREGGELFSSFEVTGETQSQLYTHVLVQHMQAEQVIMTFCAQNNLP